MNRIQQLENKEALYLRLTAMGSAKSYTKNVDDNFAATLALLWCAFETEAMAQGLTQWRGIQLGDDHEN